MHTGNDGEWESRLKQMAHGKLDRRHFMEDIRGLTREIVERVRNFRGETIEGEYATIDAKCPNCGEAPSRRITRLSAAKTVIG